MLSKMWGMLAKCTEWEAHHVSRNENIGEHWMANYSRSYQWSDVEGQFEMS